MDTDTDLSPTPVAGVAVPPGPPSDPPPPEPPPPGGPGAGGGDAGGEAGEPGATPDGGARHRELVRPRHGRILGGVAAGLASHFDVDVLLVRIVLVALAVFSGVGVLAYLIAWALIPAEGSEGDADAAGTPGASDASGAIAHGRRSRLLVLAAVVLAGLAIVDLGANGPWWPHRSWNVAPGFWLLFGALVVLIVLVARGPGDSAAHRVRRLLVALLVAGVALVTVAVASVLTAVALTGVPLRGGIGDSHWQPASAAQLPSAYRLAVGRLDVDLRSMSFPAGTRHLNASVGVGQVQAEVPPGPTVSVVAHSGVGDVRVFGIDHSGIGPTRALVATGADQTSTLVLDVQAGVGQVQVVRVSS